MFSDPEKIREELQWITEQIRAVLADDLLEFPVRTAKKRYLALPEFAATLTAEKLGDLKETLRKAGQKSTDEILATLKDERIWIDDVTPPGNKAPKSLRDNRAVTETLAKIAETTRVVLEDFGFPEAILEIHYDTPTWFINGQYLPGLIEKYWNCLWEHRQQARENKRAQHDHDLQMPAERWEEA